MLLLVALCFSVGIAAKLADMAEDDGMRLGRHASWLVGITYGSMMSVLMWAYPALSPLVIAVILGVIFTEKIDHEAHYFGIGSIIFLSAVLGVGPVDPFLLVIFLAGGALDEIGSDMADRKRIRGILAGFFRLRLTMELLTLAVSVLTGEWMFFIAMVSADAGYSYVFRLLHRER